MADTPEPTGAKDSFGFLTRKMGPAPVWLWALLAVGGYYLYTKYKSGSASTATATGDAGTDPATGITYAQELSDAQDQIATLQAQVNAMGQGGQPVINVDTSASAAASGTGPAAAAANSSPGASGTSTSTPAGTTTTGTGAIATATQTSATPTPTPATRPTSIVASGADSGDINQIAAKYGLTESQLLAANPALKTMTVKVNGKTVKLYGSGQPIPKGTTVKIPAAPPAPKAGGMSGPTTKAKAVAKPNRRAPTQLSSVPAMRKAKAKTPKAA